MLYGVKMKEAIERVLFDEEVQLKKIHDLVQQSVVDQELITSHLLETENDDKLTFGQMVSDKLAAFGGSWTFIISFMSTLGIWILINIYFMSQPFDPFPFILLNLILSCLASLQAPVIMMSQNRQEIKDRRRARSDYMINVKAEMEVQNLHVKIDLLMAEQMKTLFEFQKAQLEILNRLEKHLKVDHARS